MQEEDRNSFSLKLEDMENWLYEDGEFAERSVYQVSHAFFGHLLNRLSQHKRIIAIKCLNTELQS